MLFTYHKQHMSSTHKN